MPTDVHRQPWGLRGDLEPAPPGLLEPVAELPVLGAKGGRKHRPVRLVRRVHRGDLLEKRPGRGAVGAGADLRQARQQPPLQLPSLGRRRQTADVLLDLLERREGWLRLAIEELVTRARERLIEIAERAAGGPSQAFRRLGLGERWNPG